MTGKTPRTFDEAIKAKIRQHVSSILFFINDGTDPAEAIAYERKTSVFGSSVWEEIEARVYASEARTHDLTLYVLTFRPTACQPIRAISFFAKNLEAAHDRGRKLIDEDYPAGVWVMLAPATVKEYAALRDGLKPLRTIARNSEGEDQS